MSKMVVKINSNVGGCDMGKIGEHIACARLYGIGQGYIPELQRDNNPRVDIVLRKKERPLYLQRLQVKTIRTPDLSKGKGGYSSSFGKNVTLDSFDMAIIQIADIVAGIDEVYIIPIKALDNGKGYVSRTPAFYPQGKGTQKYEKFRGAWYLLDEMDIEGFDILSREKLYVVRLYDGFDNIWMDVCEPVSLKKAQEVLDKYTEKGTKSTCYDDIDYYHIFPADTKMLFSYD